MPTLPPDLTRTWLFGPGADARAHEAMQRSGADALIVDLEDLTPEARRDEARRALAGLLSGWRDAGQITAVRINALEGDGPTDLAAAMPARPDMIAYPMTVSAAQMHALHAALTHWEAALGIASGTTEILPVCETALGVINVRAIAGGSSRIRAALLGAEDLAADLCAERHPDAVELEYARRRFLLECRAAAIEPIDAPYTFSDIDGACARCVKRVVWAIDAKRSCAPSTRSPSMLHLHRVLTRFAARSQSWTDSRPHALAAKTGRSSTAFGWKCRRIGTRGA